MNSNPLPSSIRQRIVVLLLLAAAVAIVFGPLLEAAFVPWDDNVNVYANPEVVGARLDTLAGFWSHSHQELYMPVVYDVWALLSMISRAWHGPGVIDPHLFHAANLFFHLASVCFVFLILDLLTERRHAWAAGLGAALFALHPLQVEPVAWVTGLKDVLSGTLGFVSLWLYLIYTRSDDRLLRWRYGAGALFFYALALLAKPVVITLPVMAALLDWAIGRRPWKTIARDIWLCLVPMALVLLLNRPEELSRLLHLAVPWWQRPRVAMDALWFYMGKFLFPYPLEINYGLSPSEALSHSIFVPAIEIYLLLMLAALGRWLPRVYWAAFGIAVAALLPTLGLVQFNFQNQSTVADRYAYRALFGGALALTWLLVAHRNKRWLVPLVCAALLGSAALSREQTRYWADGETLFRHDLEKNPGSTVSLINLGLTFFYQGRYNEAEPLFRQALVYEPDSLYAHYDLGLLLMVTGRNDEALGHLHEAARMDPGNTKVVSDFVMSLLIARHVPEAVDYLEKILRREPGNARAHVLLGLALEKQGSLQRALQEEGKAVTLDPFGEDAYYSLGRMLLRAGQTEQALEVFSQGAQAAPHSALVLDACARVLAAAPDAAMRNGARALEMAQRACTLMPATDPVCLETLADAYAEKGDFATALKVNRQALDAARALKHDRMAGEIEERGRLFERKKPYHAHDAAGLFPEEL